MARYDYDLIVIGGGGAGLVASKFAAGIGKKVLLIEKNKLGGECTWTGCVPSKTLIHAANVARKITHLNQIGLSLDPTARLNSSNLMDHITSVIQTIYQTHTPDKLQQLGIQKFFGSAQFINKHTLILDNKHKTARNIIISTGSRPAIPPIEGLETTTYVTNETFFNIKTLPESIIILGGGAIGVEMGCALNALGVTVMIIEMNERILQHQDHELVDMLSESMKDSGITLQLQTKAVKVEQQGDTVVVHGEHDQQTITLEAQMLFVAVGRRANTESLNLQEAGVEYSKRGIVVNKKLQTTANNIYACGDVVGPYLFSHMAYYQAAIAARNALLPFSASVDYTNVTWTIFSYPEFASAGLTETQARERYGKSLQIYRYDYKDLDRAHNDNATFGRGKVICNKRGLVVGAHILGERAGEIIHEIQLGKTYKIPFRKFYHVIHAYPTYSELIWHLSRKSYISRLQTHWLLKLINKVAALFNKGIKK